MSENFKRDKLIRLSQIWLGLLFFNLLLTTDYVKDHYSSKNIEIIQVLDNCLEGSLDEKSSADLQSHYLVFIGLSQVQNKKEGHLKNGFSKVLMSKAYVSNLLNKFKSFNKNQPKNNQQAVSWLQFLRAPPRA